MSQAAIALVIALHLTLVTIAVATSARSKAYSARQLILQACLALAVPIAGAALTIILARQALARFPPPDNSRFDPNYFGSGD